jgi:PAS domain S-box-containing protein
VSGLIKELQQQNEFLKTVLDYIPHVIYVIDAKDFTIKLANQPGRQGSLTENATCYSYIHNNSKLCGSKDHVCPLEQVKKTKKPVIVEHTHYDEVGNPKNIEVQAFPILDTEGNVVQMIECCMDITERKRAEEALQGSEEKYRRLFEEANDAIFLADVETGIILDANRAAEHLLGRPTKEIVGMHQTQLHAPDKAEYYKNKFREHVEAGHAVDFEAEVFREDGGIVPVYISASVITLRGREIIQGIFRDVTERKRIEKVLRESEEKFYKAFHRNPSASAINAMKDGKFVDVNEGFCLITGYTHEEVIGHTADKLGILSAEVRRELIERVLEHGAVSNLLIEFFTKTGETRLALYSAERFSIGDEQFLIVLANDITEGKLAAEALQESRNRYRELADSLPQIIFELDNRGYFAFANRNAFQATGYTQEDLDIGMHALQVFVPEDRERVQRNIQRVLSGEELEANEYRVLRKDGSTFPVVIYSTPIMKGNTVVGLRGIAVDITKQKLTKGKSTG